MPSPRVEHWIAFEQILCYLKGTHGHEIVYMNHRHICIQCYVDAN